MTQYTGLVGVNRISTVHRKTRTATCPKCSKRRQNSLPVSYMDDVTEQQVRKIDELVREEFDSGDWVTVEKEKR